MRKGAKLAIGVAFGLGLGTVFSLALDNFALGISLGIAIGASLGAAWEASSKSGLNDTDGRGPRQ